MSDQWWHVLTFLGSFVAPTIAVLSLRHAVKRADVALSEWRLQKLAERDAVVAVDALKIALRYVDLVRQVSLGATRGVDDRPQEVKLAERWALFDNFDNEFNCQGSADVIVLSSADLIRACSHVRSAQRQSRVGSADLILTRP
jgi:hypothetical protein